MQDLLEIVGVLLGRLGHRSVIDRFMLFISSESIDQLMIDRREQIALHLIWINSIFSFPQLDKCILHCIFRNIIILAHGQGKTIQCIRPLIDNLVICSYGQGVRGCWG